MKFDRIRPAIIIFLISWWMTTIFVTVKGENGVFQSVGQITIYAIAMEGENIYLAGSANNKSDDLISDGLNLAGGLKDIYLAKYDLQGNLQYEALIGGSNDDSAFGIAVYQGVMYVLGESWSKDFPGAPGNVGEDDAVVFAVAADGSQIQWARRLGGSDQDSGRALVVENDSIYFTGISWSSDLVAGAARGNADGFLARMDLSGQLNWLKVFGGSGLDAPYDLEVGSDGIWLTGQTFSNNFGSGVRGGGDIFAARFNFDGTLALANLYGSRQEEIGYSISLGKDDALYIGGATQSTDLPSAVGSLSGKYDGLVVKIDPAGSLMQATYMGGSEIDYVYAIQALSNGNVLVSGMTASTTFPLGFNNPFSSLGGNDAFAGQLNSDGQISEVWQLGGAQDDRATEFIVTSTGLWLSGQFSDQAIPFLTFLALDDMPNVNLPTNPAPIPTATKGITATPFPTETPVPTFTNTFVPGSETNTPEVSNTHEPTSTLNSIEAGEIQPTSTQMNGMAINQSGETENTPASTQSTEVVSETENSSRRFILPIIIILSLMIIAYFLLRKKFK